MIKLADERPLASGIFRHTYRHPDDPAKVIKIARADAAAHELDPNLRELRAYQTSLAAGAPLERYFPRLHGFVETDLGQGLCADYVRGSDGQPAMSLMAWVQAPPAAGPSAAWVLAEYRKLADFCIAHLLFASVDELNNVGFVRDGAGWRLVAYDLKLRANREAIPISALAFFRRRKIARRFQRSIAVLEQRLAAPT